MASLSVSTFQELKSAIEDSTTTEINVTSDITFSGGAKVNLTKGELIINFNGHTVTDNNNSSFTDTIYIASTSSIINVTVRNVIWSGRNYYGVVGVYDGNTNSTINLENITYTGPQFVYNKYGTTNIKDSTITLDRNSSSTNPQEFCEANRLNIQGKVTVISNSTSNAVIWFTSQNASLTVEENATFEVTASSTYFLYTDVSPVMTFKQNSSTKITTKGGLFYNSSSSSHIASSFSLQENASFVAYKTTASGVPLFKCLSNFEVKDNSIFQLISQESGAGALMYFGQVANISISNPKNIVLYNNGGNVFSFQTGSTSTPNTININAQILRLWNTATNPYLSAGGFLDIPTSEYYKQNYLENVQLMVKSTNSTLTSVESNLTNVDNGYPADTSTLKLLTSKVISMGNLSLSVNEISDISTTISGQTGSFANVKAEYLSVSNPSNADTNGDYSISVENSIPVGTNVKVSTNKHFLTKFINVTSVGSVSITSLSRLDFFAFTTPANKDIIFRQKDDWNIQITDTRTTGDNWYLYVYIKEPLSYETSYLENSLIYRTISQDFVLSSTPILVYTGKRDETNKVTTLTWDKIEGFLLKIKPQELYDKGNYQTNILWQVTTVPLNTKTT